MPNFTYCMNCYGAKTYDRISERLCGACEEAGNQAVEFATRENMDPGQARRAALLSRAPGAMAGKSPSSFFEKVDTTQMQKREMLERGSLDDPRRSGNRP